MTRPAEATPSGNRLPGYSTCDRSGKLPSTADTHTDSSPRRAEGRRSRRCRRRERAGCRRRRAPRRSGWSPRTRADRSPGRGTTSQSGCPVDQPLVGQRREHAVRRRPRYRGAACQRGGRHAVAARATDGPQDRRGACDDRRRRASIAPPPKTSVHSVDVLGTCRLARRTDLRIIRVNLVAGADRWCPVR